MKYRELLLTFVVAATVTVAATSACSCEASSEVQARRDLDSRYMQRDTDIEQCRAFCAANGMRVGTWTGRSLSAEFCSCTENPPPSH